MPLAPLLPLLLTCGISPELSAPSPAACDFLKVSIVSGVIAPSSPCNCRRATRARGWSASASSLSAGPLEAPPAGRSSAAHEVGVRVRHLPVTSLLPRLTKEEEEE